MRISRRTTVPVAAVASVLSLTLALSACSDDSEDDNNAGASSTVTSTRSTNDPGGRDGDNHDHEGDGHDADGQGRDDRDARGGRDGEEPPIGPAPADPGSSNTDGTPPNPFGGPAERGHADPVAGGPASDEDAQAIKGLVLGANDQPTQRDAILYLPRHSCSALTAQNGGADELAGQLNGLPGMDTPPSNNPGWRPVTDVADIRVDGDRASANVTVEGEGPSVQRYAREDGQWKFCN